MQWQRIVVGVDGSPESLVALRRARALADEPGAVLSVVTAWHQPVTGDATLVVTDMDAAMATEQDRAIAAVFGDERPAHLETALVHGTAAHVLCEMSADADLLVLGSRGHGGVAGLLLGSVSMHCAEKASCDVLVVRERG